MWTETVPSCSAEVGAGKSLAPGQQGQVDACVCILAGATLFGKLEQSGIGEPLCGEVQAHEGALGKDCRANSQKLFAQLREDPHGKELMRLTLIDAELERMATPIPGTPNCVVHRGVGPVICAFCSV